ncbi:serine/threonine protein kinase [Kaarinaea lacus]
MTTTTTTTSEPSSHPYDALTPDVVLDAVESIGVHCDGRLLALNSYENRVYQVGVEEQSPLVVKFYRPGRWTTAAIMEEHEFTLELAAAEIPVVPPMQWPDGSTLHESHGFRFAVYLRRGGHWPELDNRENLEWMGRFIARIHTLGKRVRFQHRPTVDINSYGHEPVAFLLEKQIIPMELQTAYSSLLKDVLQQIQLCFDRAGDVAALRLHGDCHPGNVLWTDDGPHFVDFDDARMGPAIQDLWMLLSGEREEMAQQLSYVLEGYTQFCDFDARELNLIEPLRSLRLIHYSAWLARRWEDPSFPINFPWFGGNRYWEEQILTMREQLALMQEEPLPWL